MQYVLIISKIIAFVSQFHLPTTHCTEKGNTEDSTGNISVTGYINIKNETYRATCNCPSHIETLENMVYRNKGLCQPSKLKVRSHNVIPSDKYSVIYNIFKRIPLDDFVEIKDTHISSMDGRITKKSLFSPGGDLGLFIQTLFIMFNGQASSEDMVTNLMRQYVQSMPPKSKFSHATDEDAISDICKALQWDSIDLTNINSSYQLQVKELITKYYGDRYLQFLSQVYRDNPEKNSTFKALGHGAIGLIIHSVNAFYNILWDKNDQTWEKMKLDILHGEFKPEFIVEISVSRGCELAEKSPIITPKVDNKQILVYTEYAANIKRKNIATFIYKSPDLKTRSHTFDEILLQLDRYGKYIVKNIYSFQLIYQWKILVCEIST
ncbi:hypothetical protein BEWA_030930 [Theileria equi strain WA]|uniref:Signal peptide-containing protein n=1 Tax=Theileria equi strain WA TaxID=1537102 RepID=L0AXE5_THEEQ|nr:hypothetical protein BEWA_030930 [Theileria equi strain WA]AFZ80240.1 hypothetical protein BEWA_030930 [Theileria equi strain WA]|eukprot:XP_004829906.1 hypothetical protein BEWA_030930 [Theileria equi strain WA]